MIPVFEPSRTSVRLSSVRPVTPNPHRGWRGADLCDSYGLSVPTATVPAHEQRSGVGRHREQQVPPGSQGIHERDHSPTRRGPDRTRRSRQVTRNLGSFTSSRSCHRQLGDGGVAGPSLTVMNADAKTGRAIGSQPGECRGRQLDSERLRRARVQQKVRSAVTVCHRVPKCVVGRRAVQGDQDGAAALH
jgi:hypothetical protein